MDRQRPRVALKRAVKQKVRHALKRALCNARRRRQPLG